MNHTSPGPELVTEKSKNRYQFAHVLAALGVVFGDIGTSPLYALRECFYGPHALEISALNVYGILSLIFWSLLIVISLKYISFIMHADNKGEGGVLALMALAHPVNMRPGEKDRRYVLLLMGLFGAALLYGDGMITPAITVLSAVEGLNVATPFFEPYIVPIAIVILVCLFLPQHKGTHNVGSVFGPIILLWFVAIAALGIIGIVKHPTVLAAANPYYAFEFFVQHKWHSLSVLGIVILVVTGGEALYADMGHFGAAPIRRGWFMVVLPALLLNYFGQAGLLIDDPLSASNPFFRLAPEWAVIPMVCLATFAAIIASQALISGAYSLTKQAVQMGYFPRLAINHTSKDEIGQIYVPFINWMLLFATIWLVLFFRSSSNLAAAYGLAVTATMVITTILVYFVARDVWRWTRPLALLVVGFFLAIDMGFLAGNMLKFFQGGWFPLFIGFGILMVMLTWRRGRQILAERLVAKAIPLSAFQADVERRKPHVLPGTAVFMTSTFNGTPPALVSNVHFNRVIHEHVIILLVKTLEQPYVPKPERVILKELTGSFYQMTLHYGFMETPNVPAALRQLNIPNLKINLAEVTYFLGRETLIATRRPGMAVWREKLFAFMSRNAQRATSYFRVPSDQVVEIGIQVEL